MDTVFPPLTADLTNAVETTMNRVRQCLVQVRNGHAGAGAGIIWSADGTILTNNHVVGNLRGQPRVILSDGAEFQAEMLARDPEVDLAFLRIPGAALESVQIGDSQRLQVGQLVFAVGHPWGQPGYVTSGILSSISHATTRQGRKVPILRMDLSLAPGNSGGPLVNAEGEVIGINTMIIGGDQGVAVPIHLAREFFDRVSHKGNGHSGSTGEMYI